MSLSLLFFVLASLVATTSSVVVLEGSATSYAQFHQWQGGANSTLEMEFRTNQRDCLLLYTDNRRLREYLQITLSGGSLRVRYNWGPGGPKVFSVGKRLGNGRKWHSLAVIKSGVDTTVVVDRTYSRSTKKKRRKKNKKPGGGGVKAKPKRPADFGDPAFGNASTNSFVFVGGLPSWYGDKMEDLVLPTVLLEPRLKGSVRNLRYSRDKSSSGTIQEMMAYKVMPT